MGMTNYVRKVITDLKSAISLRNINDNFQYLWLKLNSLQGGDLKDGSIEGAKIKNDSIDKLHIKDGSIDSAKIGEAQIKTAHIDTAQITSAKIKNASITSAKIGLLQVDNGHIKDATIEGAKIKHAQIDTAHIKNGAIDNAKIGDAQIDTAKIKDASITSAKILEGQIGSGHISELNADLLSAGTIDTSAIAIRGTNGRLRMENNRLQVFDYTNDTIPVLYERVSLGDVNGDGTLYGLRVRGADGQTILLDENGVKEEGITDGAITNEKISPSTKIDGVKLDIDSVVTEINNGTKTIQGSKIYMDNKTLDVELSDVKTKQEEHNTAIENNTTNISSNATNISLKANQQDFIDYKDDMELRVASAEQKITPEAIDFTVKSQRSAKIHKVRYIRDWANGSTSNNGNHWVELQVINNKGENVALGKGVKYLHEGSTGIDHPVTDGDLVTDGNPETKPYYSSPKAPPAAIVIDLGTAHTDIDNIIVWHYWSDGRTYHNTKTEISHNGADWVTLFDSAEEGEYPETSEGHSIPVNSSARLRTSNVQITDEGLTVTKGNITGSILKSTNYSEANNKTTSGTRFDLVNGGIYTDNLEVNGSLIQYDPGENNKGIAIENSQLKAYDWKHSGEQVGSVGALSDSSDGFMGIWSESGKVLKLGGHYSGGGSSVRSIITIDTESRKLDFFGNVDIGHYDITKVGDIDLYSINNRQPVTAYVASIMYASHVYSSNGSWEVINYSKLGLGHVPRIILSNENGLPTKYRNATTTSCQVCMSGTASGYVEFIIVGWD